MEFGVTVKSEWTVEERISYHRGALRGYLSDILPNREYANHYAVRYEMTDDNEYKVNATWRDHRMLFPVPNHIIASDSRVYFFYKWEIVGDGGCREDHLQCPRF
jgi:hypothetical protein